MLSLPPSVRILLAREPADLRKGFDGLAHLVQDVLRENPLSGHLFVFRNRRGDRVKLLLWDTDGFLILYKRATLYTLVGSCKRHRVDPFAYLKDILERLPTHPPARLGELLPDAWLASHHHARLKVAS